MDRKTCTKCGVEKALGEFRLLKGRPRAQCKSCDRAELKAWREENRIRIKAYKKEYRTEHLASEKAKRVARYAKNPEPEKARAKEQYYADPVKAAAVTKAWHDGIRATDPYRLTRKRFEIHLRLDFKMTPYDFAWTLHSQNYECANSGCRVLLDLNAEKGTRSYINIDHCHTQGHVRGILCQFCNWSLGHAFDSPKVLRGLAAYLEQSK